MPQKSTESKNIVSNTTESSNNSTSIDVIQVQKQASHQHEPSQELDLQEHSSQKHGSQKYGSQEKKTNTTDNVAASQEQMKEVNGYENKAEPTRYGDWEIAGRCFDF